MTTKKDTVRVGKEAISRRGETHSLQQKETKWVRSRCCHVRCGENSRNSQREPLIVNHRDLLVLLANETM